MATLVRPSTLPYDAPQHAHLFGNIGTALPGDVTSGGSWADDSDDTAIGYRAASSGGTWRSSVVAVDFAPAVILGTPFDVMTRLAKYHHDNEGGSRWRWILLDKATGGWLSDGRAEDFTFDLFTTQTWTSGPEWYDLGSSAVGSEGFTLATAAEPTNPFETTGDILHYTVFEFGLLLDSAASSARYIRKCRRYPRGD